VKQFATMLLGVALAIAVAGCDAGRSDARGGSATPTRTGAAGMITAGGSSSGEVIAATKAAGVEPKEQGTPGIPQGAGGNVGGTELGGTVDHQTSLGGRGEKSPAQAAKAAPERPTNGAPASPAAR
jgi:ABC-type phosphate transport system substrate-binding protein